MQRAVPPGAVSKICLMAGLWITAVGIVLRASSLHAAPSTLEDDGSIDVPAFMLPESSLISEQTRNELRRERERLKARVAAQAACPQLEQADLEHAHAIRECEANALYNSASYARLRDLYGVTVTSKEIGGVYTEIFDPEAGIPPSNRRRVLINLHGGGFRYGSRSISHLESIPISSTGKIKVVSVDYRMAPEFRFPAASQDAAAVYRELLKKYKPSNVGIYGCSAGGLLTAEVIAWLQRERLPIPGAVGMFCGAGDYWTEGDSGYIAGALAGTPYKPRNEDPLYAYFGNVAYDDALAFPAKSDLLMAKFPPALLITATRDPALSSVVHTHAMLVRAGIEAELHVFEGLGHAFFFDPDLPESRDAYQIIVNFFNRKLGKQ